jgi:hypothetical protein
MPDTGTPLCTYAQFTTGPFQDLVSDTGLWTEDVVNEFLLEATRQCEDEIDRRLTAFTVTETHRAEGIDPDEYGGTGAGIPMSIQDTLGSSYAQALGAIDMVRHVWLDEKAPKYPDMWQYSDFSCQIIRSYGGTQDVPLTQILNGPEPDTGHVWFQLGLFLPVGSRIAITYTAGYNPVPASLVRACKFMCAENIVRELDPDATGHNPDQLHTNALLVLSNWMRS